MGVALLKKGKREACNFLNFIIFYYSYLISIMPSKYKYAMVCSSNNNRSMEAHGLLAKKGYHVESYGTGNSVRLPGKGPGNTNAYPFGTPYEHIYQDLKNKDQEFYLSNGMIGISDRN